MPRRLNVAGPCEPEIHYMLPATRVPSAPRLVADQNYSVIQASRQSGKTTATISLAHVLTASGEYVAVLVSVETSLVCGATFSRVMKALSRANSLASDTPALPHSLRADKARTHACGPLPRFETGAEATVVRCAFYLPFRLFTPQSSLHRPPAGCDRCRPGWPRPAGSALAGTGEGRSSTMALANSMHSRAWGSRGSLVSLSVLL